MWIILMDISKKRSILHPLWFEGQRSTEVLALYTHSVDLAGHLHGFGLDVPCIAWESFSKRWDWTPSAMPGTTIHRIHWALWWLFRQGRDWSCGRMMISAMLAKTRQPIGCHRQTWVGRLAFSHHDGPWWRPGDEAASFYFSWWIMMQECNSVISHFLFFAKRPLTLKSLPASAVEFLVFRHYWNLLKKNICTTKKPEVLWKTCPKRFGQPFSRSPGVPLRNNASKLRI